MSSRLYDIERRLYTKFSIASRGQNMFRSQFNIHTEFFFFFFFFCCRFDFSAGEVLKNAEKTKTS